MRGLLFARDNLSRFSDDELGFPEFYAVMWMASITIAVHEDKKGLRIGKSGVAVHPENFENWRLKIALSVRIARMYRAALQAKEIGAVSNTGQQREFPSV